MSFEKTCREYVDEELERYDRESDWGKVLQLETPFFHVGLEDTTMEEVSLVKMCVFVLEEVKQEVVTIFDERKQLKKEATCVGEEWLSQVKLCDMALKKARSDVEHYEGVVLRLGQDESNFKMVQGLLRVRSCHEMRRRKIREKGEMLDVLVNIVRRDYLKLERDPKMWFEWMCMYFNWVGPEVDDGEERTKWLKRKHLSIRNIYDNYWEFLVEEEKEERAKRETIEIIENFREEYRKHERERPLRLEADPYAELTRRESLRGEGLFERLEGLPCLNSFDRGKMIKEVVKEEELRREREEDKVWREEVREAYLELEKERPLMLEVNPDRERKVREEIYRPIAKEVWSMGDWEIRMRSRKTSMQYDMIHNIQHRPQEEPSCEQQRKKTSMQYDELYDIQRRSQEELLYKQRGKKTSLQYDDLHIVKHHPRCRKGKVGVQEEGVYEKTRDGGEGDNVDS